jgi:hypothetical protein
VLLFVSWEGAPSGAEDRKGTRILSWVRRLLRNLLERTAVSKDVVFQASPCFDQKVFAQSNGISMMFLFIPVGYLKTKM